MDDKIGRHAVHHAGDEIPVTALPDMALPGGTIDRPTGDAVHLHAGCRKMVDQVTPDETARSSHNDPQRPAFGGHGSRRHRWCISWRLGPDHKQDIG